MHKLNVNENTLESDIDHRKILEKKATSDGYTRMYLFCPPNEQMLKMVDSLAGYAMCTANINIGYRKWNTTHIYVTEILMKRKWNKEIKRKWKREENKFGLFDREICYI